MHNLTVQHFSNFVLQNNENYIYLDIKSRVFRQLILQDKVSLIFKFEGFLR